MTEYIYGTDGREGHWLTGEEVVRCRDCEYYKSWLMPDGHVTHECYMDVVCTGAEDTREAEPDGFCSWGVRREQ